MEQDVKPDELRRLSDAATPGPWGGCAHVERTDPTCPCRYRGDVHSKATDEMIFQMGVGPDKGWPNVDEDWKSIKAVSLEQGYTDGQFIVALVNAYRSGALIVKEPTNG